MMEVSNFPYHDLSSSCFSFAILVLYRNSPQATVMIWFGFRPLVSDLQNYEEPNKNRKNGRTRIPERTDVPPHKFESSNNSRSPPKESKPENRRNQESTMKKQSPPCKPNTPPVRPKPRPTPAMQRHANNIVRTKENIPIQRKPAPQQQEVCTNFVKRWYTFRLKFNRIISMFLLLEIESKHWSFTSDETRGR